MTELSVFFFSDGMAGGLIGAFLLLGASRFGNPGIKLPPQNTPLRDAGILDKLIFVGCGGILAAIFDYSQNADVEILICTGIGAGWPYIVIGMAGARRAILKGKDLMKVAIKESLPGGG